MLHYNFHALNKKDVNDMARCKKCTHQHNNKSDKITILGMIQEFFPTIVSVTFWIAGFIDNVAAQTMGEDDFEEKYVNALGLGDFYEKTGFAAMSTIASFALGFAAAFATSYTHSRVYKIFQPSSHDAHSHDAHSHDAHSHDTHRPVDGDCCTHGCNGINNAAKVDTFDQKTFPVTGEYIVNMNDPKHGKHSGQTANEQTPLVNKKSKELPLHWWQIIAAGLDWLGHTADFSGAASIIVNTILQHNNESVTVKLVTQGSFAFVGLFTAQASVRNCVKAMRIENYKIKHPLEQPPAL